MSAPRNAAPSGENTFEHDADIGVVGRGATLEEAFESAAAATFGVMADLSAVRAERSVAFRDIRRVLKACAEAGAGEVIYATFQAD